MFKENLNIENWEEPQYLTRFGTSIPARLREEEGAFSPSKSACESPSNY
jgi:hypothetical protein